MGQVLTAVIVYFGMVWLRTGLGYNTGIGRYVYPLEDGETDEKRQKIGQHDGHATGDAGQHPGGDGPERDRAAAALDTLAEEVEGEDGEAEAEIDLSKYIEQPGQFLLRFDDMSNAGATVEAIQVFYDGSPVHEQVLSAIKEGLLENPEIELVKMVCFSVGDLEAYEIALTSLD